MCGRGKTPPPPLPVGLFTFDISGTVTVLSIQVRRYAASVQISEKEVSEVVKLFELCRHFRTCFLYAIVYLSVLSGKFMYFIELTAVKS